MGGTPPFGMLERRHWTRRLLTDSDADGLSKKIAAPRIRPPRGLWPAPGHTFCSLPPRPGQGDVSYQRAVWGAPPPALGRPYFFIFIFYKKRMKS